MDNRDYYIFGEPVETVLGNVRFITYKDYIVQAAELSTLTLNVLHIYYQYLKKIDKNKVYSAYDSKRRKILRHFRKGIMLSWSNRAVNAKKYGKKKQGKHRSASITDCNFHTVVLFITQICNERQ